MSDRPEGSDDGLEVSGLCVGYGGGDVVHDVSLCIPAGSITALLGPNGSGKSTLLKAIAGVLPYRGKVCVEATALEGLSARERAKTIAYVPQRTLLRTSLRVERVIAQGRFAASATYGLTSSVHRDAVERAVEAASIGHLVHRSFTTLSGGERQRVLLARALATGAKTLLLDEPTSAQDVANGLVMAATLRSIAASGTTILAVVHDLREVREIAHSAALLSGGRIVQRGTALSATQSAPVRDVFGVDVLEGASLGFRLPDQGGSGGERSATGVSKGRDVPQRLPDGGGTA